MNLLFFLTHQKKLSYDNMKKNYIASLALVFCAPVCLAQEQKKETNSKSKIQLEKTAEESKASPQIAPLQTGSAQKKVKAAPEVFYIVDDKAVDYKTYLLHLQKTKNQH